MKAGREVEVSRLNSTAAAMLHETHGEYALMGDTKATYYILGTLPNLKLLFDCL
jgi:hypothetical protein